MLDRKVMQEMKKIQNNHFFFFFASAFRNITVCVASTHNNVKHAGLELVTVSDPNLCSSAAVGSGVDLW